MLVSRRPSCPFFHLRVPAVVPAIVEVEIECALLVTAPRTPARARDAPPKPMEKTANPDILTITFGKAERFVRVQIRSGRLCCTDDGTHYFASTRSQ
jgi:hypothetical protein